MRILCCLDGTNLELLRRAISTLLSAERATIGLVYVTDRGPQDEMERQRVRFLRSSRPPLARDERILQDEELAAQEILEEGGRAFAAAERHWRTGRPEREIMQLASEWQSELIVIGARAVQGERPYPPGPKSVGHVARFVLDHALCPVLLVRPGET